MRVEQQNLEPVGIWEGDCGKTMNSNVTLRAQELQISDSMQSVAHVVAVSYSVRHSTWFPPFNICQPPANFGRTSLQLCTLRNADEWVGLLCSQIMWIDLTMKNVIWRHFDEWYVKMKQFSAAGCLSMISRKSKNPTYWQGSPWHGLSRSMQHKLRTATIWSQYPPLRNGSIFPRYC